MAALGAVLYGGGGRACGGGAVWSPFLFIHFNSDVADGTDWLRYKDVVSLPLARASKCIWWCFPVEILGFDFELMFYCCHNDVLTASCLCCSWCLCQAWISVLVFFFCFLLLVSSWSLWEKMLFFFFSPFFLFLKKDVNFVPLWCAWIDWSDVLFNAFGCDIDMELSFCRCMIKKRCC